MPSPVERAYVVGVPVDRVTAADVLAFVREHVVARLPAHITTVNAEYVVRAQHDAEFLRVLRSADLATPDSAGVLWALRRQGIRLPYRVGGSDLIWSLSLQAAEFGHRVFLLGGQPGIAERAAERLTRAYPGLCVAGTFAGTPRPSDEESIVHLVRRSEADILFVAFGAPRQDLWIARNLVATGVSCALGIGGSFDYVAGAAARAPVWMREYNLDWLWRLAVQPWRWRRMLALPRFAWLVLRQDRAATGTERMGE